jgi:uncharacterized membrane protein
MPPTAPKPAPGWPPAVDAAASLGLAALLVALAASGLALFVGTSAAPAQHLDAVARELQRNPLLAHAAFRAFVPALLALTLGVLALAAAAPRAPHALGPSWPRRLRASAWTLAPLALLPTTLWYDDVPGRAILAAALIGLTAALAVAPHAGRAAPLSPRAARAAAAALATLAGAFLFATALARHRAHWSSLIDLGLFYELYDNPESRLLYSPTLGMSFLGEHFSPILALLWPIVAAARSPVALLAIQAASIAGGAFLLYELAALRTKSHALGLAMLLAYALAPYVQQAAYYDFHLDMLEPPLLFGFVLAIFRRRLGWMWLCAVLLWATKEDTFIYTSVIAVVLLVAEGRRREGLALVGAGLAVGLIVLTVVLPALRTPHDPSHFATVATHDGYAFGARYANLGASPAAALRLLLLNPFGWISDIVTGPGLSSVLALLLLFGPTPLTARWRILLLVPAFEMLLGDLMRTFPFYYGAVVLPFAALAAVEGAHELTQRRLPTTPPAPLTLLDLVARRTSSTQLALALFVGSVAVWTLHPSSALATHSKHGFARTDHQVRAEALMDALPPGVPVAATGYLAAHLQSRHPTTMLPYGLDAAERVIVDLQRPPWPLTYAQLQSRLESLVSRGDFTVETADREAGLIVLARAAARVDRSLAADAARALRTLLASPVLEAELTEDTAFPDARVRDPDAHNGALLSVGTSDARGPAHIFYGPYLTLPPGIYRATFRLRWHNDTALPTADLPPAAPLVTIDAFARAAPRIASQILAVRDLAPREGQLHEPTLEFTLTRPQPDFELRVFHHDLGRLDLDQVRVDFLGPPPPPRDPRPR